MIILGIESSCDETSAAVVVNGREVHANTIATSKQAFAEAGGVIPEKAARMQIQSIIPTLHQCLDSAGISPDTIDAIAVTYAPGLFGSLLVGTTTARALSSLWKKPLIGVHHTLGHLSSAWLEQDQDLLFPCLSLSASGGHTELWLRESHTNNTCIGKTQDDAAGEAFDKGASILGLPYPGGPSIAAAADGGALDAYSFALPLRHDDGYNFSFSGLKTALKHCIRDNEVSKTTLPDLASSYQHALCRHLVHRIKKAVSDFPEVQQVHIVGGVSANTHLRSLMTEAIDLPLITPSRLSYCTDNAAMIAAAAYFYQNEQGDRAYAPFETSTSATL